MMNDCTDLVSVIIPTYKRASMLKQCIESVLNQSYSNIEVIIVDDNDTGSEWRMLTAEIMSCFFNNKKVIYIKHEINKNGSAARNTGFLCSKGKYICFLDDDDVFKKNKIMKQVDFLNTNSTYGACCCDYEKDGQKYIIQRNTDFIRNILLSRETPQTSGIMFCRDAVRSLNGFDETYIRHQDYEFLLRFFDNGYKMGKIDEILYIRKRSNTNNLPNGDRMLMVKEKFLDQFDFLIRKIDRNEHGFRKKVQVKNYFTVMKCYLKDKNFKKSFRIFLLCISISPIIFIVLILQTMKTSVLYQFYRISYYRKSGN